MQFLKEFASTDYRYSARVNNRAVSADCLHCGKIEMRSFILSYRLGRLSKRARARVCVCVYA